MATDNSIQHKTASPVSRNEPTRSGRLYRPNVDIVETPDELIVRADMPGTRGEDIDVHLENGVLTLYAKVADRYQDARPFLAYEYGVGDFYRTFEVTEAIDGNRISAAYKDGVLTLHLPKTEAVKPRKIAVRSA